QAGNIDTNDVEVNATTLAGDDTNPPTFAGLASATPTAPNQIGLQWAPASDDVTPSAALVYFAYLGTAAGGEGFDHPVAVAPPGASSLQIGGLTPSVPYYFVVRARDQAGNIDSNTVERSAMPFGDTTPPVFAGATSAVVTGLLTITVRWNAASDDVTPS